MVSIVAFALLFTFLAAALSHTGNAGGYCVFFLVIITVGCIYLTPSMIIYEKRHPKADFVCVLNLLLAWLCITWLVLLVWALRLPDHPTP